MGAMKMGPGTESATQCGAMINRQAIDKIEHLVADAVGRGAEVRLGGRTPEGAGFFYPPSVIATVQPGSEILPTEVLGPVEAVIPLADPDRAVALANAPANGLAPLL